MRSPPATRSAPVRERSEQVRTEQGAVLDRVRLVPAHVRAQHLPPAVPEQPEAEAGRELRRRPRRARPRARWRPRRPATDQFLMPNKLGFRDERIYPLRGPDARSARALARGRTRSGKAVLYVPDIPAVIARGQLIQRTCERSASMSRSSGSHRASTSPSSAPGRAVRHRVRRAAGSEPGSSGVPLGHVPRAHDRPAGLRELVVLGLAEVQPRARPGIGIGRRTSVPRLRRARRADLTGRGAAIPYAYDNALTLVSARTGCVIVNPYLDLAAVCLSDEPSRRHGSAGGRRGAPARVLGQHARSRTEVPSASAPRLAAHRPMVRSGSFRVRKLSSEQPVPG